MFLYHESWRICSRQAPAALFSSTNISRKKKCINIFSAATFLLITLVSQNITMSFCVKLDTLHNVFVPNSRDATHYTTGLNTKRREKKLRWTLKNLLGVLCQFSGRTRP